MSWNREKVLDFYLDNSLFLDVIAIGVIWLINICFPLWEINFSRIEEKNSLLSNLISIAVSLAGFILASLTIIASMRANIGNKPAELSKNPLELFFAATNYKRLVNVFKDSIVELVLVGLVLCITWIFLSGNYVTSFLNIAISAIYVITASVFRSLLVLFTIMNLE